MGKRLGIILSILIAGVALLLFYRLSSQRSEEINHYAELQRQAAPYEAELAQLQKEIDEARKDHERKLKSTGTIQVLFSELHENLYYYAYPQMERCNLTGMLLLGQQWPGDEGCISKSEFQELLNSGWSYVLCWNEDDDWEETSLMRLGELGLTMPNTVYFPDGEYSDGRREALQHFSIFLHHGETGQPMLVTTAGGTYWELGVSVWDYSTVARDIRLTAEKAGNRVYEVTFTEPIIEEETEEPEGEDEEAEAPTEESTEEPTETPRDERYRSSLYQEEYFPPFLNALADRVNEGTLLVMDFDKSWLLRKNAEGKTAEMTADLEALVSQYEARMADLEAQIDAIYNG